MTTLILNSLEVRGFCGFRQLQIEGLGRVNLLVIKRPLHHDYDPTRMLAQIPVD